MSEQWTARPDDVDKDGSWEVVTERSGRTILIAYGLTEEVARLIAAAPDMLAELQRVHEKYGHQQTADVITKATTQAPNAGR